MVLGHVIPLKRAKKRDGVLQETSLFDEGLLHIYDSMSKHFRGTHIGELHAWQDSTVRSLFCRLVWLHGQVPWVTLTFLDVEYSYELHGVFNVCQR